MYTVNFRSTKNRSSCTANIKCSMAVMPARIAQMAKSFGTDVVDIQIEGDLHPPVAYIHWLRHQLECVDVRLTGFRAIFSTALPFRVAFAR